MLFLADMYSIPCKLTTCVGDFESVKSFRREVWSHFEVFPRSQCIANIKFYKTFGYLSQTTRNSLCQRYPMIVGRLYSDSSRRVDGVYVFKVPKA